MSKSMGVYTLQCTDGLFDFYIIETIDIDCKVTKSILCRAPEGMSGALRAYQLQKEGKVRYWDRIRPATESEVTWWMEKHKEKVIVL
jgi:hypothetical protein